MNESEILARAVALNSLSGVYFLIRDGKVTYVGQAKNVMARINAHIGEKQFDSFSFLPVAADKLDAIEALYIVWLRPAENVTRPTSLASLAKTLLR